MDRRTGRQPVTGFSGRVLAALAVAVGMVVLLISSIGAMPVTSGTYPLDPGGVETEEVEAREVMTTTTPTPSLTVLLTVTGSPTATASATTQTSWPLFLPIVVRMPPPPTPTPTLTPTPTTTPSPTPVPIPNQPVTPNDNRFGLQWPLQHIRAPEGWSISTGAPVVVAILDTGVDYNHPDLVTQLVDRSLWYDFSGAGDADPMDYHGHGTHVAGSAAAASNNGEGVAGVSWGARLMPLKVLSDSGNGYASDTAEAVRYAADRGAQVINMSLSGLDSNSALREAILYARSKGVIVVAAAGNCHQGATRPECRYQNDPVTYPASMLGVLAVGATTITGAHAAYSNVGDYVDLSAPGGDSNGRVLSTYPNGTYAGLSGTSMAAPHVAGLAAIIRGMEPTLTVEEVELILVGTTADAGAPGWDPSFGTGRLDARAALEIVWYRTHAIEALSGEGIRSVPSAAQPLTDCSRPHAGNRVLVKSSEAGNAALAASDARLRVSAQVGTWQIVELADGTACRVMRELNHAAGTVVAELDARLSVPPDQSFVAQP